MHSSFQRARPQATFRSCLRVCGAILAMCVASPAFARDFAAADRALQAQMRATGPGALLLVDVTSGRRVYEIADPRLPQSRLFTPGSLAKPWAAAVLLKHAAELRYGPERKFRCAGRFYPEGAVAVQPGDRRVLHIRSDPKGREYLSCSRPEGHGRIGLTEALAHSCNAYFLTAAATRPLRFYRHLLAEWDFASSPASAAMMHRAISPERLSPLLAATAAIGEGGGLRISPARAAQLFLAQNNGGRVFALSRDGLKPSPGAGPRLRRALRFSRHDLGRIRFALGRTAEIGTLSGLARELGSFAAKFGGPLRISTAKTGTATPYAKRYGSHGWLALQFQPATGANRKQYVLVAFARAGSGGREGRRLAVAALRALGPAL